MKYKCCDLDCQREFESEFAPPTIIGDPLCPECAIAFDILMKELSEKGVKVTLSHGDEN
jgi:hypothetical protein